MDPIDRQAAIDALWKALCAYEDKTEKQFQNSDELDVGDWFVHRIFVQNMSDIDRQTILELPSAQPERKKGTWEPIVEANEFGEPYQAGVYCSRCGERNTYEPNFCPNCGADLRGEQDEV